MVGFCQCLVLCQYRFYILSEQQGWRSGLAAQLQYQSQGLGGQQQGLFALATIRHPKIPNEFGHAGAYKRATFTATIKSSLSRLLNAPEANASPRKLVSCLSMCGLCSCMAVIEAGKVSYTALKYAQPSAIDFPWWWVYRPLVQARLLLGGTSHHQNTSLSGQTSQMCAFCDDGSWPHRVY